MDSTSLYMHISDMHVYIYIYNTSHVTLLYSCPCYWVSKILPKCINGGWFPPFNHQSKMTPNPMTPWNQVGRRDQENKKPIGTPALNHPHHPASACESIPSHPHPIPGSHPWKSQPRNSTKRSPARSITLVGFHEDCKSFGIFLLRGSSTEGCGCFFQILMILKKSKKLQGTTEII